MKQLTVKVGKVGLVALPADSILLTVNVRHDP